MGDYRKLRFGTEVVLKFDDILIRGKVVDFDEDGDAIVDCGCCNDNYLHTCNGYFNNDIGYIIGEFNEEEFEIVESEEKKNKYKDITDNIAYILKKKNESYGDSFGKSIEQYGDVAFLTRMSDKFNRLESLILNGDNEVNENLTDCLMDIVGYSVLMLELKARK